MPSRPLAGARRASRWLPLLLLLWSVLALRIALAVVRGEPRANGLALPMVALFITSALLGGRVWRRFQQREEASPPTLKKD